MTVPLFEVEPLFRRSVRCANCKTVHTFVVVDYRPMLAYVSARFVYGDIEVALCVNCGMDLDVPAGAPHDVSHPTVGNRSACKCETEKGETT